MVRFVLICAAAIGIIAVIFYFISSLGGTNIAPEPSKEGASSPLPNAPTAPPLTPKPEEAFEIVPLNEGNSLHPGDPGYTPAQERDSEFETL